MNSIPASFFEPLVQATFPVVSNRFVDLENCIRSSMTGSGGNTPTACNANPPSLILRIMPPLSGPMSR